MSISTRGQVSDLAAGMQRWAASVWAGWRHRKGLSMLARLDDRGLADIGLTRSDIYDALAQRIWDDPTTMLERRRTARRDSRSQTPGSGVPKIRQARQMLGIAGLKQPPTDRPARYFV
jgi:uncharacterized protein YjiS (DUF1127 family)